MNVDLKIEAEKIALEILDGTVEQACYEYDNFLGNYRFFTSAGIEKGLLNKLGTHLSKYVRKNPENFMSFCKMVWTKQIQDGRIALGPVLASLQAIDPDKAIPEILEMCKSACGEDDVEALVSGFEPAILKNPDKYIPLLEKNISDRNKWVGRLIIMTVGHLMYRYKSEEVTAKCLEILRPVLSNGDNDLLRTSSWIIGSYGVRADQNAVASFMHSYAGTENESAVKAFSDAFRRSKIAIQPEIAKGLTVLFNEWSESGNSAISKNAQYALKYLSK